MNPKALRDEIDALLRDVLRLARASAEPSRAGTDAWDSLKHMEIVFALEDRYGVRFDESEFDALDSVDAIAIAVARHRAA